MELALHTNYCSLISKLIQATTKAHAGMSSAYLHFIFIWVLPQIKKSMWNKWKNHFSEMKGDVGMSHHEKDGEQEEDAYTKTGNH